LIVSYPNIYYQYWSLTGLLFIPVVTPYNSTVLSQQA